MGVTGWDLYSTLAEQAAYAEYYKTAQPVACPRDGTPLQTCPPQTTNILYCNFCFWKYPEDYDPETMSGM